MMASFLAPTMSRRIYIVLIIGSAFLSNTSAVGRPFLIGVESPCIPVLDTYPLNHQVNISEFKLGETAQSISIYKTPVFAEH